MPTSKKIVTTDLDFDNIKQNLKTYLQAQEQFSDYDFEGSGLSVLLDILAFNTHYNALYTNLALNEAFLDSAAKRNSVVSKAKEIGYTPTSAKCSAATVGVTMINSIIDPENPRPDTIEIPRYAQFITSVDGVQYSFYTQESYIAYRQDDTYIFPSVIIKEGTPLSYSYTYANSTRIIIPNKNVDLSTLKVTVQENALSSTYSIYSSATSIIDVDSNSLVYFTKEIDNQLYELEFGNGLIGKALENGNVITIEYMATSGTAANSARTFTYNNTITNTQVFVTTTAIAVGGAEIESIDAIKWNAPRLYNAQNRCVTLDDYKAIIYSNYPNAKSINVWGGEQNEPPSYGDVFISIKPQTGETLSDADKSYILSDIIGPRKVVTIHPKIVDPSFINVELDTTFYYDKLLTSRTSTDLSTIVLNTIQTYNENNLNIFGGILRFSRLTRLIDDADVSITSNISTIKLHCEIPVFFNQSVEYILNTGNPIYNSGVSEASVYSSPLNVLNSSQTCYIEDVPVSTDTGTLQLIYYISGIKYIIDTNIGVINYKKGLITITNLIVTGLPNNVFKFIIKPQSNDVVSIRNQIVTIPTSLIKITARQETTTDNFVFTSSRN